MLNEFQFSFSAREIRDLISKGSDRLLITGKVVYDPKTGTSTFEIYAETSGESAAADRVIGCPMPC
jgi:hypothetical protein